MNEVDSLWPIALTALAILMAGMIILDILRKGR